MRHLSLIYVTIALAGPAAAQPAAPEPADPETAPSGASVARQADSTLDKLFDELGREADAGKSKQISERIWARWRQSGSATVDMLMGWADKAMQEKKNGLALDFLDQAITLKPDYSESWNKRATLHFIMGNHAKSMSDISRVLALEPRHFGALAGMAGILEEAGQDETALRAWEAVLDVWPGNRNAQTRVGELSDKLAGRGI